MFINTLSLNNINWWNDVQMKMIFISIILYFSRLNDKVYVGMARVQQHYYFEL